MFQNDAVIKLIDLAYKISKDRYDENGVPEVFYAMSSFSDRNNLFKSREAGLIHYIMKNSDYTLDEIIKMTGAELYDNETESLKLIFETPYDSTVSFLESVRENEDARRIVLSDVYDRTLFNKYPDKKDIEEPYYQRDYLNAPMFSVVYTRFGEHFCDRALLVYELKQDSVVYHEFEDNDETVLSKKQYLDLPDRIIAYIRKMIDDAPYLDDLYYSDEESDVLRDCFTITFCKYDENLLLKEHCLKFDGNSFLNTNNEKASELSFALAKRIILMLSGYLNDISLFDELLINTENPYHRYFADKEIDMTEDYCNQDYVRSVENLSEKLDNTDYLLSNEYNTALTDELINKLMRIMK